MISNGSASITSDAQLDRAAPKNDFFLQQFVVDSNETAGKSAIAVKSRQKLNEVRC